jgi:hypothetical protein
MLNKNNYDCDLGFFDYQHKNPPPPFNPDYNPDYVRRCKEYEKRIENFMRDDSLDDIPDNEFNDIFNQKCDEWKKELKIYNRAK